MLIKPLVLALVLAAAPAGAPQQPVPQSDPPPQEDWQTLQAPEPAPVTQEEAALMRQYIAMLEQAVLQSRNELDEVRRRYLSCQGRGRT